MSFPLPFGPYQGLFSPEPLNELPGLPLAPLPSSMPVSPVMAAPSAPMFSMTGRPDSPNRPDWATILSLVLPAVIAAMKGGGAAPLGAFYQSFARAKDVGQMREMEQEEIIQKRKTEALREEETRVEKARQRNEVELNFIAQATKELINTIDFNQFKQLRSLYLRMAQDRGLDASPIARVQFPFPNLVRKEAIDWATKYRQALEDNPEAAEKVYGPIDIITSSIKDEAGTPLTFTRRQAFEWAQIPLDDRGRPITKAEKEPVPNTPTEQIAAYRSRAKALHAVGEHEKAKVLEDRANLLIKAAAELSPTKPSMAWVVRNGQPIRVREEEIRPGDVPYTTRESTRRMTSADANRIAELDTSLSDLAVLSRDLGTTGATSKVGAMLPNVVSEITGWGIDAKARQAVIDRVKQVIGKALEGGVLRKEDEYKYIKILPTIGDPPEVAQRKLGGLRAAIAQRRATFLEALADAGFDVSQFPESATVEQPPAAQPARPPAVNKILKRIGR